MTNSIPNERPQSVFRAKILREFAQIEALAAIWDRLQEAGRRPEVFTTFGWARAAWKAYGTNRKMAVVAVYSDDTIVGLLPLTLDGNVLRFLSAPQADYNDILCEPISATAVLSAALDALLTVPDLDWTECRFENLPADGNLSTSLQLLSNRLRSRIVIVATVPCTAIVLGSNPEEKLKALYSRKRIKRLQANLQKKGKLSFRNIENRNEVRMHMRMFFQQHIRRRAMMGEKSQFLNPAECTFFDALVDALDPTRTLRFSVLELNDKPIAYHLGFEFKSKFIYYKPTFEINFWDSSPGEVLLRNLLIYCQGANLREFDFTVGDEGYKNRFANHMRPNLEVVFYRSETRARFEQLAVNGRKFLKQSYPRIFSVLKMAATTTRLIHRILHRKGILGIAAALMQRLKDSVFVYDEGFLWVYKRLIGQEPSGLNLSIDGYEIRPVSLADIADLSITYPERFNANYLRRSRERLKIGDQPFVTIHDKQVVHTFWVGRRNSIDVSCELGKGCSIELDVPGPVLIDHWTPPAYRGQGIFPQVLRQMAEQLLAESSAIYIYAPASNRSACRGIEKAGFERGRNLKRIRVLCIFEYRWLR